MRDRTEQILRGACLVLAVLVFCALVRAGCRAGSLLGAKIPSVPTLETNSVTVTNSPSAAKKTNSAPEAIVATNSVKLMVETNVALGGKTNVLMNPPLTNRLNGASTNSSAAATNSVNAKLALPNGSNDLTLVDTNLAGTNKPAKKSKKEMPPGMARGMPGGGFPGMPGMPGKAAKLPPEIQTRVDKIVESEIFAPVFHPQPMALLGIAGETVFLQTSSGQTGLLKTNEPLDGIKLLRIGINRVLVEQDGEKKELLIFDGYGGESLLPKENSK
jgi:hypothetical protein